MADTTIAAEPGNAATAVLGRRATLVTLIDGTVVLSDAEAWRDECLARHILGLPTLRERRDWVEGYEQRHGKAEADRLRERMRALHEARGGHR